MEHRIWGCERAAARSHPHIWTLPQKLPMSRYKESVAMHLTMAGPGIGCFVQTRQARRVDFR
jgi:hypothetical protein